MDMNQYLTMFIDESNDHLQSLNENMLQLESNPDDIGIVQIIFRSAHTLKGMAATMGYEDLASLTHQMENVLDLVRNEKLKMQDFIFDTLFKSLTLLNRWCRISPTAETGKRMFPLSWHLCRRLCVEKGQHLLGKLPKEIALLRPFRALN